MPGTSVVLDRLGRRCPHKRTDVSEDDPVKREEILQKQRLKKFLKKHPNYQAKLAKRIPWIRHLNWAKSRCNNPKVPSYKTYGAVGIKVLLTREQIKYLWDRDGAIKMKQPSIDRIDYNGHYELSNCRFIEKRLNRRRYACDNRSPNSGEIK